VALVTCLRLGSATSLFSRPFSACRCFGLTSLVDLQSPDLLLPTIERLLADPYRISSATGILISTCFTMVTICSIENSSRLRASFSKILLRRILPKYSLSNWINLRGDDHEDHVSKPNSDSDRYGCGSHSSVCCVVKPRFDVEFVMRIRDSDSKAYTYVPARSR